MSIQASLFLFRVLSGFTTTRYLYQVFVKTGNLLGRLVMGSSGLEPPTSRLSGARSNLLSYKPMLVLIRFHQVLKRDLQFAERIAIACGRLSA